MHKYALLLAVVTACGGGGNVSKEDFPKEAATAACAKVFDCCSAQEVIAFGTVFNFDDEDSCALRIEALLSTGVAEFEADIEAGLVVYNGGAAQDCIDDLKDSSCTSGGVDPTCDGVFVGQLENGESCSNSDTCESGNCENGRCENPPGVGEACADNCADGLACVGDTCRERAPDGAACITSEECESGFCGQGGVCAVSMTCDGVD